MTTGTFGGLEQSVRSNACCVKLPLVGPCWQELFCILFTWGLNSLKQYLLSSSNYCQVTHSVGEFKSYFANRWDAWETLLQHHGRCITKVAISRERNKDNHQLNAAAVWVRERKGSMRGDICRIPHQNWAFGAKVQFPYNKLTSKISTFNYRGSYKTSSYRQTIPVSRFQIRYDSRSIGALGQNSHNDQALHLLCIF